MNRIAITKMQNNSTKYAFIGLDENRVLMDFELFDSDDYSLLNNIYVARVENIVKNINSAFVKIADNQNCYLSLDNAKAPFFVRKNSKKSHLSIGDEILVQVIKDAVKTKDPVVSCDISFHGKHCILTTGNKTLGISKKINSDKAKELWNLINDYINMEQYGIVVRTSAMECDNDTVLEDIRLCANKLSEILSKAIHSVACTKLYSSVPGYIMKLKSTDFSTIDSVVTDCAEVYDTLIEYYAKSQYRDRIKLYNDEGVSLSTLYNLSGQIDKLISNKVWLKSGANIIIEQLETLTVIDINTGKNIKKDSNTILNVNKEAAVEIARQLRLRNISGMIIIDFINMTSETDVNELIDTLKHELSNDSVKCSFIDITKLGLVELTRKKVRKSLKDCI